jgi:glyoxylase-like metal-dependent hydrolase (beta-lactamase superfamily II)
MPSVILASVLVAFVVSPILQVDVNITAKKVTDNVLVLEEDNAKGHTTVISTAEGLVLVDVLASPLLADKARALIEKEFGNKPILNVIITHFHGDHVNGHQVYKEATTIAHADCRDIVLEGNDSIVKRLASIESETSNLESAFRKADPDSPDAEDAESKLIEALTFYQHFKDFEPTEFDLFITDGMTITPGGKEIQIMYFGPCHTSSDLVVFVPEERVLITGDLVFHNRLPHIRAEWGGDVPNTIATLDRLIAMSDKFEHVVPGHGDVGGLQVLEGQRNYLIDLWTAVLEAREKGLPLERAKWIIKPAMAESFENYRKSRVQENIEACWKMLDGRENK